MHAWMAQLKMKAWSEIAKSSHLTTIGLSVRLAHTIISTQRESEKKKKQTQYLVASKCREIKTNIINQFTVARLFLVKYFTLGGVFLKHQNTEYRDLNIHTSMKRNIFCFFCKPACVEKAFSDKITENYFTTNWLFLSPTL